MTTRVSKVVASAVPFPERLRSAYSAGAAGAARTGAPLALRALSAVPRVRPQRIVHECRAIRNDERPSILLTLCCRPALEHVEHAVEREAREVLIGVARMPRPQARRIARELRSFVLLADAASVARERWAVIGEGVGGGACVGATVDETKEDEAWQGEAGNALWIDEHIGQVE